MNPRYKSLWTNTHRRITGDELELVNAAIEWNRSGRPSSGKVYDALANQAKLVDADRECAENAIDNEYSDGMLREEAAE